MKAALPDLNVEDVTGEALGRLQVARTLLGDNENEWSKSIALDQINRAVELLDRFCAQEFPRDGGAR